MNMTCNRTQCQWCDGNGDRSYRIGGWYVHKEEAKQLLFDTVVCRDCGTEVWFEDCFPPHVHPLDYTYSINSPVYGCIKNGKYIRFQSFDQPSREYYERRKHMYWHQPLCSFCTLKLYDKVREQQLRERRDKCHDQVCRALNLPKEPETHEIINTKRLHLHLKKTIRDYGKDNPNSSHRLKVPEQSYS